ncbi:hypothetical protein DFH11DRAFT_1882187 [Phellopilus nigrolimitatus]|nr:hypothetical protein DFH11DRAFT_1882187 [Phellopilus nigrolimitatus]
MYSPEIKAVFRSFKGYRDLRKGHRTRFYPTRKAHAGQQDSVRTTRYTVIFEENRFPADDIQQGAHDACYLCAPAGPAGNATASYDFRVLKIFRARIRSKDIKPTPAIHIVHVSRARRYLPRRECAVHGLCARMAVMTRLRLYFPSSRSDSEARDPAERGARTCMAMRKVRTPGQKGALLCVRG